MKSVVPMKLEDGRIAGDEWNGAFIVQRGSARLRLIISDGLGWEHVSVSLHTRCPTWEEMCFVKELCFEEEECVMQLHPPKSEWINNHPFCLHLWRPKSGAIPQPPGICVGVKELGVIG